MQRAVPARSSDRCRPAYSLHHPLSSGRQGAAQQAARSDVDHGLVLGVAGMEARGRVVREVRGDDNAIERGGPRRGKKSATPR